MFYLYSIFIAIYYLLVRIASLVNPKANLWINGRKAQFKKLQNEFHKFKDHKCVWIHASSYGEFEMAWPLINSLIDRDHNIRFIVSFYSPSGYEHIQLDSERFIKIYLPLDLKFIQNKYLNLIKPSAFISMKYDFWFNLMRAMNQNAIPYYYVGTHLEDDSYLFEFWMKPFLNLIKASRRIYTHSENSSKILKQRGFKNVSTLGDLRILQALENLKTNSIDISWSQPLNKCIVYGSVTDLELKHVIKTINALPDCNHILAIHDIAEKTLKKITDSILDYDLLSQTQTAKSNVLIVDGYGQLKYLYKNADLAYIGGAFEKGPHNILEALIYNTAVLIGPNIKKFPLAQECSKNGIIQTIESIDSIPHSISEAISLDHQIMIEKAKAYIQEHKPDLSDLIDELN